MFYIFKNLKLVGYSDSEVIQDGIKPIKLTLTDLEIIKLKKGCLYENGVIIETQEYLTEITKLNIKKIKKQKSIDINKIATLSDQLNLLASVLDTITSATPDQAMIDNAKLKFAEIKTILNK